MNKKVLIFDFDGTIADSGDFMINILNNMAPDFGIKKLNEDEIKRLRNYSAREVIRQLRIPIYKIPFIVRRFRSEFRKIVGEIEPIPGVPEALLKLNENGHTMHIVSSNTEENIRFLLKKFGIDCFDRIEGVNGIFGKYIKIRRIVRNEKLLKENVIYIGDEARDVEMGRRVGVKTGAVLWGLNTKEALLRENPDYLFSKPEELLQL